MLFRSTAAPVLNAEQRTLRVLFIVDDPMDLLRPGMFARIGVGTDERQTVQVPADCILHIGSDDVILVVKPDGNSTDSSLLEIRTLACQEQINSEVEVRSGVKVGETVVAKNAILLKPIIVKALAMTSSSIPLDTKVTE